jgi:hypothetical protein
MGGRKMVTITDSGCHKHQPCQITFSGASAWMVERFIVNLPMNGGKSTYVCEHGHTHLIVSIPAKQEIAVNSMEYDKFTPEILIDLMA